MFRPRFSISRNTCDLLLCSACREKDLGIKPTEATECGCLTRGEAVLCFRHAFAQNRCRHCGADLKQDEIAMRKLADRIRRRRELKTAIKEREPFKEAEADQRQQNRKDSGNGKKVRQRHKPRH